MVICTMSVFTKKEIIIIKKLFEHQVDFETINVFIPKNSELRVMGAIMAKQYLVHLPKKRSLYHSLKSRFSREFRFRRRILTDRNHEPFFSI